MRHAPRATRHAPLLLYWDIAFDSNTIHNSNRLGKFGSMLSRVVSFTGFRLFIRLRMHRVPPQGLDRYICASSSDVIRPGELAKVVVSEGTKVIVGRHRRI